MSSIKDLTYHQLQEHKRMFENALSFAFTDLDRKAIGVTIEGIQAEMDRRQRKTIMSMVITVNLLVLIAILFGGCGTFDGLSKLADGVRSDVHHITQPVDKEK